MKDIRIDKDGEPRCWNCGSKGLIAKRTTRSKVMVGVGALLTKKKLKCQRCGEYNDTGNGKPYNGPEGRKYRSEWEAEQRAAAAQVAPPSASPTGGDVADQIAKITALHEQGALTDEEFAAAKARILGA